MSKQDKIMEARFFLDRMNETTERSAFRYYLSAFLSAARSVLQYAHREIRDLDGPRKTEAEVWYADSMRSALVLEFLRDKRDVNIHEKPPNVRANVDVRAYETISVSDTVSVQVRQGGKEVLVTPPALPKLPTPPANPPPGREYQTKVTTTYFFEDWDPDSVLELCPRYCNAIESMVAEGVARGYLQSP